jgi:hypothetical protein
MVRRERRNRERCELRYLRRHRRTAGDGVDGGVRYRALARVDTLGPQYPSLRLRPDRDRLARAGSTAEVCARGVDRHRLRAGSSLRLEKRRAGDVGSREPRDRADCCGLARAAPALLRGRARRAVRAVDARHHQSVSGLRGGGAEGAQRVAGALTTAAGNPMAAIAAVKPCTSRPRSTPASRNRHR